MKTEMTTEQETGWLAEADLAKRLGVPVGLVSRAKDGIDPVHVKKEGRRNLISEEGAGLVAETLGLERVNAGAMAAGGEGDDEVEIVAHKVPLNPRIVFGSLFGELVRVRVPDSRTFVPVMKMRARLVEGDVYALVGRGPRYKGRY